jgi:DeoR family transcriptional regulator, suf operon transcriptional repressor
MSHIKLHSDFLESTRGRVIGVIRRGKVTVDEIASELRLTGNAVRAQLATLQRDGLVRAAGVRPGATRPSQTYELTPELEHLLSRAYLPLLTHLVRLFAANEPPAKFDAVMRQAGQNLAREIATPFPTGPLNARVGMACQMLNRDLGASTKAEKSNGSFVIRGSGCPLAALTGKHRGVCLSIESLLAELLQTPVRQCCERAEKPRCCFEVLPATTRGARNVSRPART